MATTKKCPPFYSKTVALFFQFPDFKTCALIFQGNRKSLQEHFSNLTQPSQKGQSEFRIPELDMLS